MTRKEQLDEIFRNVDESQKQLVDPLIEEVIFLEDKMKELKKLPFINIHPTDSAKQKLTPAAKLYKECTQSYMNAIRILSSILHKVETSAQDDLLKLLEDFQ